ncbi:MAG: hypothetical protein VB108_09110 [Anaerolineaceae bacterium]|nr:hypothetical protein [Anaerolineaceae bacterium]
MKKTRCFLAFLFFMTMLLGLFQFSDPSVALADAATKRLSTNYTIVNLGTSTANVTASYFEQDGTAWSGSNFTNFQLAPGANSVVRQYFDTGLTSGQGSVVLSSDQPVAAVVQQLARNQAPSEAAYTAIGAPSSIYYVPFVSRHGGSAGGTANSQIVIQNTSNGIPIDVVVEVTARPPSTVKYVKTISQIQPFSSYSYDLELQAELGENFWGSAKVSTSTANGTLAVMTNMFSGSDSLIAYNGFPQGNTTWFIPYLYVRLGNSLTTSIILQNIGDTAIPVNDIQMSCVKDPSSPGVNFTVPNDSDIPVNGAYGFNTLTDTARFSQEGWYGGCKLISASGKQFVTVIQYRKTANKGMSAYEAVPGSLTSSQVTIPLIAKRLANGFATSVAIQNLGSTDAIVKLVYTPEGGGQQVVRTNIVIPAKGSIQRNFRLADTEGPEIPDGWVGSLSITSDGSSHPLAAFVGNWKFDESVGDTMQAYLGFNH